MTPNTALQTFLLFAHPAVLMFIGAVFGIAVLYFVAVCRRCVRTFGTAASRRDREAQAMREIIAAADRLQVSDRA